MGSRVVTRWFRDRDSAAWQENVATADGEVRGYVEVDARLGDVARPDDGAVELSVQLVREADAATRRWFDDVRHGLLLEFDTTPDAAQGGRGQVIEIMRIREHAVDTTHRIYVAAGRQLARALLHREVSFRTEFESEEASEREYRAVIWTSDASEPGIRVVVLAKSLDEARQRLRTEYGAGAVISVWNEADAAKTR